MMHISFDIDDTLVCNPSVPCEDVIPWWLKWWFPEKLRKGTKKLLTELKNRDCRIWIYTTSYRGTTYLRGWFRSIGISLAGAVNQNVHDRVVKWKNDKRYPPSKYPPAFGIDLHIDDLEGVGIEGKQFGFDVIVVSPDDELWVQRILDQVDNEYLPRMADR